MNPTPEQIAQAEAEEREAEAFVDAQWKAADAWIAAEWPHASYETRAAIRSVWTEMANRCAATAWQPITAAPRDGTNILLAWGQDGVSQGHYVPGLQGTHPWKFIDTNDGITWLINHAVDGPGGPTHWIPMPKWSPARGVLASNEVQAWQHEDDPARVISASQKAQALRDGGASASSVKPYSVPLTRGVAPNEGVKE